MNSSLINITQCSSQPHTYSPAYCIYRLFRP